MIVFEEKREVIEKVEAARAATEDKRASMLINTSTLIECLRALGLIDWIKESSPTLSPKPPSATLPTPGATAPSA